MKWEDIDGDHFAHMVEEVKGVCLVPIGCLERHSHHLPLGTDIIVARSVSVQAAEQEPAIVFPDVVTAQILEARHYPGTFALEPGLVYQLLESMCREIARNGLKKIVFVNGHGGNHNLLQFLAQSQLASPRDYVIYVTGPGVLPEDQPAIDAQWETPFDHHAGETETSQIMHLRPELVKKDQLQAADEGQPLGRLKALSDAGVYTGIWWYADHPTHYGGDARPASAEKGKKLFEANVRFLVKAIRLIKEDSTSLALQNEFFTRS